MKVKKPSVTAAGLALFSMFFGAGNVVFPLILGEAAGTHVNYATVAFLLGAVLFPLLGLLAMLLYDCDGKKFFGRLGKGPGMAFYAAIVLLLGPLGCTPRLLNVSYATLQPYLFGMGLPLFSILTAALLAPFVLKRGQVMKLMGYVLTPILLVALAVIIVRGVAAPPESLPMTLTKGGAIFEGLQQGYLLLDLPAAILYAGLVLVYFRHEGDDSATAHRMILRRALKASALALVLLCITYGGLIYVGAYHGAAVNADGTSEEVLRRVSTSFLGSIGGAVASIAVGLACLTTAISQVIVCTDFLGKHAFKGRKGVVLPMILTLGLAVTVSLFGFSAIIGVVGPILMILTPALVVLCLSNIGHKLYEFRPIKLPVGATFVASIVTLLAI